MVKKSILLLITPIVMFGSTYKIVEPDLISEVESRKDLVMKNTKREFKKAIEKVAKLKGESLIKSPKTYTYYVDPTFTLKEDIPRVDRNGNKIGVLYPKGYTFNPLDFTRMTPPPIIAFNACDKKELTMAQELAKRNPATMFASSGCETEDFPKNVDRRIYLVTKEMKEKFNIKYTVSVIGVDLATKRIKIEVFKADR